MEFELAEEFRMLRELVANFVADHLLPLQQMANEVRLMRIYDGPTEIHNWVIARDILR
jgi:alkylation response protein AidB-like acyl-CoA dehydrogenase